MKGRHHTACFALQEPPGFNTEVIALILHRIGPVSTPTGHCGHERLAAPRRCYLAGVTPKPLTGLRQP